jgi:hypothetical protein
LEWGVVAKRHSELYGAKNCDVMLLGHKFNAIANTVPPTGDPNIPAYIQLTKDIMWEIEIRMDSWDAVAEDLGIEGVEDFEEDTEAGDAGDDRSNLLEEFNEQELVGELHNNQQPEVVQQRNNMLCNDLPVGLNNQLMVPQTPAVSTAPYPAYLATGSMNQPPFMANHSAGKFSSEDYYQQMIMSQIERQEIEKQEREWRRAEREECLAELEIQRQERKRRLEEEKRQREHDQEDERKEQAEERKLRGI